MFVRIGIPEKTNKFRQTEKIDVKNKMNILRKKKEKEDVLRVQNDYAMV